ncbi:MAG: tRNA-(ms[2]io[6]A)-hydroxylase [Deltaproteobacteria bacterium]|nr:tRNA-(ms[2]io[6]A)-hydroxylase [Nannocystaceae bacterium]
MLHLYARTDPAWGRAALACLDEILVDHAHCEKKAASTAIGLVFRYPDLPKLAVPLARLAREELEHFELVIGHIRRRGGELSRLRPSPYAAELMAAIRKPEPARALDTLLCCSLIEARSCDRMQVLHRALAHAHAEGDPRVDAELVELYEQLLACEARHHGAYVELARSLPDTERAEIDAQLDVLARHEAEVIAGAPVVARLHANLVAPVA